MLKALLNGMRVTLTHFFKRSITLQYPDEKWTPPDRFRGQLTLLCDDAGSLRCVACGLCERICPCECITVIPESGPGGVRALKSYSVDLLRCCFCGLCVESCPMNAIAMGDKYELADYAKESLILDIDALTGNAYRAGQSDPDQEIHERYHND